MRYLNFEYIISQGEGERVGEGVRGGTSTIFLIKKAKTYFSPCDKVKPY